MNIKDLAIQKYKFDKQTFGLVCKYKMHLTLSALRSSDQPLKLKQLEPTAALGWIRRAQGFLNQPIHKNTNTEIHIYTKKQIHKCTST